MGLVRCVLTRSVIHVNWLSEPALLAVGGLTCLLQKLMPNTCMMRRVSTHGRGIHPFQYLYWLMRCLFFLRRAVGKGKHRSDK